MPHRRRIVFRSYWTCSETRLCQHYSSADHSWAEHLVANQHKLGRRGGRSKQKPPEGGGAPGRESNLRRNADHKVIGSLTHRTRQFREMMTFAGDVHEDVRAVHIHTHLDVALTRPRHPVEHVAVHRLIWDGPLEGKLRTTQ